MPCSAFIVDLGKSIQVHLWLVLDSNLVNMMDLMLLRLTYFTITTLKLLSCSFGPATHKSSFQLTLWTVLLLHWSSCWQCFKLQAALKWFYFPHPPPFLPHAGTSFKGAPYHSIYTFPLFLHSRWHTFLLLCTTLNNIKFFPLLCHLVLISVPFVLLSYMPIETQTC